MRTLRTRVLAVGLVTGIFLWLSSVGGSAPAAALPLASYPRCAPTAASSLPLDNQRRISQVAQWITRYAYRRSTGALQQSAPVHRISAISPWWGNEAALALLGAERSLSKTHYENFVYCRTAGRWLDWVLGHLTEPGHGGAAEVGGIAKWYVKTGVETRRSDSELDNAAASTLTLANAYMLATGDAAYFTSWRLSRLAQLSSFLDRLLVSEPGDDAALARARPHTTAVYTADNVTVWAGYQDYGELLRSLASVAGAGGDAVRAAALDEQSAAELAQAARVQRGLEADLYLPGTGTYRWAIGEPGGWSNVYPEAVAELFPIAWSDASGELLPEMTIARRTRLLDRFAGVAERLGWARMANPTGFTHLELASAAMGTPGAPSDAVAESLQLQAQVSACLRRPTAALLGTFVPPDRGQCGSSGMRAPHWNLGDASWYLRILSDPVGVALLGTHATLEHGSGRGASPLVRFVPSLPAAGRYLVYVMPGGRVRRMRLTVRSGAARFRPRVTEPRRSGTGPLFVGSYRLQAGHRGGVTGSWVQLPAAASSPATAVAFVRAGS